MLSADMLYGGSRIATSIDVDVDVTLSVCSNRRLRSHRKLKQYPVTRSIHYPYHSALGVLRKRMAVQSYSGVGLPAHSSAGRNDILRYLTPFARVGAASGIVVSAYFWFSPCAGVEAAKYRSMYSSIRWTAVHLL